MAHTESSLPFIERASKLSIHPEQPEDSQASDALFVYKTREEVKLFKRELANAKKIERRITDEEEEIALLQLVTLWQRVRSPRSDKTIKKTRLVICRLVNTIGDVAPRSVTRAHIIRHRDKLEAAGTSEINTTKQLALLNTLFGVAVSEGAVTINCVAGVKARKSIRKHSSERQEFSISQISLMFCHLSELKTEDERWTILLLAFHGARSGELAQMRCCDIDKIGGIDVFKITDIAGNIKNRHSLRDVPLHPECCDFLQFVHEVEARNGKEAYVFQSFPQWKETRAGRFQINASKWLRNIGINDKRLTLHSLRHTWRTLARDIEMPETVSRAIMGHTLGSGEHGIYGGVPALKLRAKWLEKIDPLGV